MATAFPRRSDRSFEAQLYNVESTPQNPSQAPKFPGSPHFGFECLTGTPVLLLMTLYGLKPFEISRAPLTHPVVTSAQTYALVARGRPEQQFYDLKERKFRNLPLLHQDKPSEWNVRQQDVFKRLATDVREHFDLPSPRPMELIGLISVLPRAV